MRKVTKDAKKRKRQEWTDRLQRFQNADLTVARFCQAESVSTASFYQWKRKLTRQAKQQPAFETVQLSGNTHCYATHTALTVCLPNGSHIHVASNLPTVQVVMRELLNASPQAESC
jgi:hypothetical protein